LFLTIFYWILLKQVLISGAEKIHLPYFKAIWRENFGIAAKYFEVVLLLKNRLLSTLDITERRPYPLSLCNF
jgi:hypothetical protein